MTFRTVALVPLLACVFAIAQDAPAPTTQPAHRAPVPDKPFELQPLTPEFWKVFSKDAKLETMGTGFAFTEGPVWDSSDFLWVSDEKGNQIIKLHPDGRVEPAISVIDPDGSPYDRQHRLWSTSSGERAVIELSPDGKRYEV